VLACVSSIQGEKLPLSKEGLCSAFVGHASDDDLEAAIGARIMDGVLVTKIEELWGVNEELERNRSTVERRSILLVVVVIELLDELLTPGKEVEALGREVANEDVAMLFGLLSVGFEACEDGNLLEIGAAAREFDERRVE
jgi:hypothetical protein